MAECIFCSIVSHTVPTELIAESDDFIVIKDIHPQAPVHLLIVSREHIPSINDVEPRHQAAVGAMIMKAKELAKQFGLSKGYKLVLNCGSDGGQVIPHLHIHLLGGKKLNGFI